MAGIEKKRSIGLVESKREVAHFQIERTLVEIEPEQHLESKAPQHARNVFRVVDGVGQSRTVLIVRIADNQRDPFLGTGRSEHQSDRGQDQSAEANMQHEPLPPCAPATAATAMRGRRLDMIAIVASV